MRLVVGHKAGDGWASNAEGRTFHGYDTTVYREYCGVEMEVIGDLPITSVWLCLEPVPCPVHDPQLGRTP